MAQPDLADLDIFALVARTRSFRGAAGQRGLSPSALSEAVRRLEARLGVRLLNRTTRSVTPTEAGQRLLERLEPALREVRAAVDAVNGEGGRLVGTLRLNVPTIVARLILPPIVEGFLRAHPGVAMEVVADDTFIDMVAAGFDAGIRYDESLAQDMIAVPIGPRTQRFVVAASPAYLAARGTPAHPRDLLAHDCIRHRFASGRLATWEFERGGEVVRVAPQGRFIASALDMEVSAALAGLGIIATFGEQVQPALDDGRLVEVLADWSQPFSGPFLYYASRDHMPAPLRAFVDHVKALPRG